MRHRNEQVEAVEAVEETKLHEEEEVEGSVPEGDGEATLPVALSDSDGEAELADIEESSTTTTETYSVLNELADEFQLWHDRGETDSGSKCSMDALPAVIGTLRTRAKAYL